MLKEKIEAMINIYTRVVTGIFLFICVYLICLTQEMKIRVQDIIGVHIVGLMCAVTYLPLMKEKMSKHQAFIMNVLYFLSINITVFAVGYLLSWFTLEHKASIIMIEAMIISIYVLIMFIVYKIDLKDTKEINQKLQERNRT